MRLIERFFRRSSEKKRPGSAQSETAIRGVADGSPVSHAQTIRDGLALDVSSITPDMPYEEAQRRFDALNRFDSEMPPVKVRS